jgi:putative hydrolase of the HAD superfamily
MPAKVIVLDIDDTLYLEREYVKSGLRAVSEWASIELGLTAFYDQVWSEFERGHRGNLFDRALMACNSTVSGDVLARMLAIYRSHRPSIALLDDAVRFLAAMARENKIAIVSDGPLESQLAKVAALDLGKWASPIILTEAYGESYRKPSSRAFQLITDHFGLDSNACCYIADNPLKDFRGPKSLGWRTVRIRRQASLHVEMEDGPDVDTCVESMDGLSVF